MMNNFKNFLFGILGGLAVTLAISFTEDRPITDKNYGLEPDNSVLISGFTCPTLGVTITKLAQHCTMVADSVNATRLYINDVRVYPHPVGSIEAYGGASAPIGWLFCDGSAVSRTTYSALFAIVGTVYGAGDGSTTFNLPNTDQKFVLGKATLGTGSTLGGTGGVIDHLHTVDPPNTTSSAPSATIAATNLLTTAASPTHTHDVNIAQFNSGSANPPYLVLNYIIKY